MPMQPALTPWEVYASVRDPRHLRTGPGDAMAKADVIAIEEHFATPELQALSNDGIKQGPVFERLNDLGELRIREMDGAGIDLQVLSETAPAAQAFQPDVAVRMARRSNDYLHAAIKAHPDRFAGFAALPTPDPAAAANELERAVDKLRFKGAMIMGLTGGRLFLDKQQFWPIFERASALDVPLYIHPGTPNTVVDEVFYKDYPILSRAALGYTVEAATHGARIIVSGVLDRYPNLKIILGHLGEAIPFLLWRIDNGITRQTKLPRSFTDYFRQHFYLTTSGALSNSALTCSIAEMGVDRIIFAADWPYQLSVPSRKFIDEAPISEQDRKLILSGNARKLLRL
jgi:predicted TIM-barrel fold metal-dependent hydrolase